MRRPKPKRRHGESGKNLGVIVMLRASPEEKERWQRAAEEAGANLNAWLRALANENAGA